MAPLYQRERVQVGDEFVAAAADWKSLEAGSHFELMTWDSEEVLLRIQYAPRSRT